MHIPIRLSKKAGVVLAVLVFALIGAVSFVFLKEDKKTEQTREDASNHERETLLALLDSDGDGLKDWEEAIYTTNPKNPDTDGDGAEDGAEIVENRDPLRVGPNDTLRRLSHNASPYALLEKVSDSGNMTEALLQQIIQTKGAGFLDIKNTKNISSELIRSIKQIQESDTVFSEHFFPDSKIVIHEDGSDASMKRYFNSIAISYENAGAFSIKDDETAIVAAAVQKKDKKILEMLSEHIAVTEKLIQFIKETPVPRPLLTFHKKELWHLEKARDQYALLKNMNFEDPFYILAVTNLRLTSKKGFGEFHRKEIPSWLTSHRLAFSKKEKALLLYSPEI